MSNNTETIKVQDDNSDIPSAPESISSNWTSIVPMLLIFVVFYFLLIRPQEKRRKQQLELVNSVKKGEKIITNTGLFGTVTKINESDNTIMLQIASEVEVQFLKTSIADILSRSNKNLEEEKHKNKVKIKQTKKKIKKTSSL